MLKSLAPSFSVLSSIAILLGLGVVGCASDVGNEDEDSEQEPSDGEVEETSDAFKFAERKQGDRYRTCTHSHGNKKKTLHIQLVPMASKKNFVFWYRITGADGPKSKIEITRYFGKDIIETWESAWALPTGRDYQALDVIWSTPSGASPGFRYEVKFVPDDDKSVFVDHFCEPKPLYGPRS